jgi:hypothetical protein
MARASFIIFLQIIPRPKARKAENSRGVILFMNIDIPRNILSVLLLYLRLLKEAKSNDHIYYHVHCE